MHFLLKFSDLFFLCGSIDTEILLVFVHWDLLSSEKIFTIIILLVCDGKIVKGYGMAMC